MTVTLIRLCIPIFREHTSQDYVPKMQIRLIEKTFDVGSHNRIKLSSSSTHLFNKCRQAPTYIGVVRTFKNHLPSTIARQQEWLIEVLIIDAMKFIQ